MAKKEAKENRKEIVFDAAVQCFNENGYYKASMDLIAERAGMTKRGIYYHFKSKDELFIQLFDYMNRKYYAQIPESASSVIDPEQRLLMFVKIARRVLLENSDFLKFSQEFMSISVRKPEIRAVMTAYYNEQVQKVQSTIEEGIASGQFVEIDSKKMARAIVLITLGVFNVFFPLDADFDYVDQHTFDIEHMIRGLKRR